MKANRASLKVEWEKGERLTPDVRMRRALNAGLQFADSYGRLQIFCDAALIARFTGMAAWTRQLGELWTVCDNIWKWQAELKHCLSIKPFWPLMMDRRERARFAKLPNVVTLFRGCGRKNRIGFSWSLNRSIAEEFPNMNRYRTEHPRLITAEVPRQSCVALKLCRNEEEVIAFVEPQHVTAETRLVARQ